MNGLTLFLVELGQPSLHCRHLFPSRCQLISQQLGLIGHWSCLPRVRPPPSPAAEAATSAPTPGHTAAAYAAHGSEGRRPSSSTSRRTSSTSPASCRAATSGSCSVKSWHDTHSFLGYMFGSLVVVASSSESSSPTGQTPGHHEACIRNPSGPESSQYFPYISRDPGEHVYLGLPDQIFEATAYTAANEKLNPQFLQSCNSTESRESGPVFPCNEPVLVLIMSNDKHASAAIEDRCDPRLMFRNCNSHDITRGAASNFSAISIEDHNKLQL